MKGRMALPRGSGFHDRLGLLHGGDDIRVGGTAAQIAAHVLTDVGIVFRMSFAYAGDRRHDLSWRAVAALECIVVDEGLLHRMRFAGHRGETFDGGDGSAPEADR